MVKNPPANPGDAGDWSSIPGVGRSSGGGNATSSSILAWEIPWTEEAVGLQSMGWCRVGHNLAQHMAGSSFRQERALCRRPVLS